MSRNVVENSLFLIYNSVPVLKQIMEGLAEIKWQLRDLLTASEDNQSKLKKLQAEMEMREKLDKLSFSQELRDKAYTRDLTVIKTEVLQ